jgi:hypothetical protein
MTRRPRSAKPLSVFLAAERICAIIADAPDEAAIEARIRAEVAAENAKRQERIDAVTALVPELDRGKLPGIVLARLDAGGMCGFSIGTGANDAAPADEVPERLRHELPEERARIGRGR